MRVVFLGSGAIGVPSLKALAASRLYDVQAVVTQPDRPAGRELKLRPPPIKIAAQELGLSVFQPVKIRAPEAVANLAEFMPDVIIVAAYGQILPKTVLSLPPLGCINIHASLLPRHRGAAPIQAAILAGDAETGITIMQMDEGLDTGPILLQQAIPIGARETAGQLGERLAGLGACLIVEALDCLARGILQARPQPSEGATYAAKLRRDEARLDWRRPAAELERQVRAFDPWPGAYFEARGERLRVLDAEADPKSAPAAPGTVLDERLSIACGEGIFRPLRLQRAGRAPLDTPAFLRGFALPPGTILPCPATS